MINFIIEGGMFGMIVITISALLVLVLTVVKAYDVFAKGNINKKGLNGILFFGSIAPLTGIIWQMLGIMQAFTAIQKAGDIAPAIIMGGLKVSMLAPLYGMIVLFFAAILWYILKWRIEAKQD